MGYFENALLGSRCVSIAAIALAALGCAADAGGPDDALEEEALGEATQEVVSDPSSVATHGYCYGTYVWNGTTARVYWPASGGCGATVDSPLVILLRGDGYLYTEYHGLLRHLARNGFIAASIDVIPAANTPAAYAAAADTAWAFVEDFLFSSWSLRQNIDQGSLALVGHSKGGAAARFLADRLSTERPNAVKSVVGLAPMGSADDEFVTGVDTDGFMTLHGTSDGDVGASGPYRHHDLSGDMGSQFDPAVNPHVLYRSMKLLQGATHAGFSDKVGLGTAQEMLTRGYVLSFLKKHNAGDATWYEDYVRGDTVPHTWSGQVVSQYSDGFARRVIDHFDDGALANSTIGDAVTTNGTITAQVVGLDTVSLHSTYGLQVTPASEGSSVQWAIPSGKRNALLLEWLSLRVGQVSGAAADDVFVQIRNGSTWSAEVPVAAHGVVAQPLPFCITHCFGSYTGKHMGTVRVPLAALGAHDDVTAVRVKFRGDTLAKGFILDNLEFSEGIFQE